MIESEKMILTSLEFATERHKDQKYGALPYTFHLHSVVNTLNKYNITDPITVASGYLHDVLEDTDTTFEELKEQFGEDVANIVQLVSNKKSFEETVTGICTNPRAMDVKLADRISNMTQSYFESNKRMMKKYLDQSITLTAYYDQFYSGHIDMYLAYKALVGRVQEKYNLIIKG